MTWDYIISILVISVVLSIASYWLPLPYINSVEKRNLRSCHLETPQEYFKFTLPQIANKKKEWIHKIFRGEAEHERIFFTSTDYVIFPDKDWNDNSSQNLHLLAFFKSPRLRSIRDLTAGDIELLKMAYNRAITIIEQQYGVKESQIKAYFHYYPSTWQLHLHLVNVNKKSNSSIEHTHNFHYVIQNLELHSQYYQMVTLQTKIYTSPTAI